MLHWRLQIRRNLSLAAGLLSISLALGGFHAFGHLRAADLNLDKALGLDSFTGIALAKGRHVANDLATLYKIRQLTSAAPQPAKPRVSDSTGSPAHSLPPVEICSGVFHGPPKRSPH